MLGKIEKEAFINTLKPGTYVLEDWEIFSEGIVGVTPERDHVVYSYDKLVTALANAFLPDAEDEEDAKQMAIDWLEYNTLGSISCWPEAHRPIVLCGEEEEEDLSYIAMDAIAA